MEYILSLQSQKNELHHHMIWRNIWFQLEVLFNVHTNSKHLGRKHGRKKHRRASGIMHSRKMSAVTRLSAHGLNQTPLEGDLHVQRLISLSVIQPNRVSTVVIAPI